MSLEHPAWATTAEELNRNLLELLDSLSADCLAQVETIESLERHSTSLDKGIAQLRQLHVLAPQAIEAYERFNEALLTLLHRASGLASRLKERRIRERRALGLPARCIPN